MIKKIDFNIVTPIIAIGCLFSSFALNYNQISENSLSINNQQGQINTLQVAQINTSKDLTHLQKEVDDNQVVTKRLNENINQLALSISRLNVLIEQIMIQEDKK
ncbi:hypothetical protein ACET9H_16930 [Aeromonas media]|uniref:hypothetical protein n=1 Tax=Aeromonas media TaxID=651 RepID=UPI0038D0515F